MQTNAKKSVKVKRPTVAKAKKVRSAARPKPAPGHSQVSNLAALAGGALGGYFGQPALGATVGRAASSLLGFGDYELVANSLMPGIAAPVGGAPVPFFSKNGKRGIRITEREYLGDIFSGPLSNGASQFNVQSYPINPAQPLTFPWLSPIAAEFEQWEPLGMVFEFKSTSSTFNGGSQALGTVIMGTDYDPMARLAVSKVQLENMDYSDSCKASSDMMHGIECAPLERSDNLMLCRPGPIVATNDSLRFYDLGTFQVATQGCSAANVNLGELWVTYDVVFYKKQLTPAMSGNQISTYFRSTDAPTPSAIFGGSATSETWGSLAMTRVGNTFTFPPTITYGRYIVNINVVASGGVTGFGVTSLNCTLNVAQPSPSIFPGFTGTITPEPTTAATAVGSINTCFILEITAPSAEFTVAATLSGAQRAMLNISQIPYSNPVKQAAH